MRSSIYLGLMYIGRIGISIHTCNHGYIIHLHLMLNCLRHVAVCVKCCSSHVCDSCHLQWVFIELVMLAPCRMFRLIFADLGSLHFPMLEVSQGWSPRRAPRRRAASQNGQRCGKQAPFATNAATAEGQAAPQNAEPQHDGPARRPNSTAPLADPQDGAPQGLRL